MATPPKSDAERAAEYRRRRKAAATGPGSVASHPPLTNNSASRVTPEVWCALELSEASAPAVELVELPEELRQVAAPAAAPEAPRRTEEERQAAAAAFAVALRWFFQFGAGSMLARAGSALSEVEREFLEGKGPVRGMVDALIGQSAKNVALKYDLGAPAFADELVVAAAIGGAAWGAWGPPLRGGAAADEAGPGPGSESDDKAPAAYAGPDPWGGR